MASRGSSGSRATGKLAPAQQGWLEDIRNRLT
jgi:hypothetical protein